jgi:transposase-like protein
MKSLLYMYRNQYGMQEIQERFNLDITTIIKLLKEHDVHIRKRVDKRK